jgi:hypothetical protein
MHAIRSFVTMTATLSFALTASAQIPEAKALLAEFGLDAGEIERVMAGEMVSSSIKPASERELVAALAFKVKTPPAELVKQLKAGLNTRVDAQTIAAGTFTGSGSEADLAKLTLAPDPAARAKAYVEAKPGGPLNLSKEEIAAFNAIGKPDPAAVTKALRAQLLARVQAYQTQGLAGIAPYALDGGKQRSPGDELRTMTEASKGLQKYVPGAYKMLLAYPSSKPAGTEEVFRWTLLEAHGEPTVTLTHSAYVPDGPNWLVVQRMYYVSTGFNAEQALAALMPSEDGGTVVVYGNRTSTDQITGFGGGTKRSIGSKVLAGQLEDLFQKGRSAAER